MGLVARALEERGIPTVCLMLLREVAEKVRPPRGLIVPFGKGQPMGPPGEAAIHERVLERALALLNVSGGEPVLAEYREEGTGSPGRQLPQGP